MIRRRLLTAVLLVALTACSDDSDDTGTPESSSAPSTTSAADSTSSSVDEPEASSDSTPAQPVIDVVHQPGEGEFDGALEDIEFTCISDGATWTAEGTVTNGTTATAGYRIFMGFLDGAGETVALIEAEVDAVPPSGSGEWSVQFDSSAPDLRCVPRVERRAG